jgi:hypothetical protein
MKQQFPSPKPKVTIEQLKSKITAWRKNKSHRSRIPQDIWDDAVLLAADYSVSKISKILGLEYPKLKSLVNTRYSKPAAAVPSPILPVQDFIELDLRPSTLTQCVVELQMSRGDKMKMHFTGQANLNLLELAKAFWSKGA